MADNDRRVAFIQALRDCADFLEQHPSVSTPKYVGLNVFVDTREDIVAHARVATWICDEPLLAGSEVLA